MPACLSSCSFFFFLMHPKRRLIVCVFFFFSFGSFSLPSFFFSSGTFGECTSKEDLQQQMRTNCMMLYEAGIWDPLVANFFSEARLATSKKYSSVFLEPRASLALFSLFFFFSLSFLHLYLHLQLQFRIVHTTK